ncbi:MAG: MptD family putative ECF transporter S component [Oscillospiraceae bacterium]|nr:MptD family putative ECF transporter S component [Oscillospiraceae bacterium]
MGAVRKQKLGMKDIIVASVLGVICIAIRMLFMLLGGLVPVMWFASHMLDAIFIGPIFMLVVAKTKRPGPVLIISLVTALVFLSASVYIPLTAVVFGLLAELALYQGRYTRPVWLLLAYICFSYSFLGDFLPLWIHKAAFLQSASQTMDAAYLAALSKLVSSQTLGLILISILIGALAGGLWGLKLMKKHFKKAGLAA